MRKQIMLKVMATALAAVVAAPIGSLTINTTRPVIVKAATAKAAKAAAELKIAPRVTGASGSLASSWSPATMELQGISKYDDAGEAWINAITEVKVSGETYTRADYDSLDTKDSKKYAISYSGMQIISKDLADGDIIISIKADGYETKELVVTKATTDDDLTYTIKSQKDGDKTVDADSLDTAPLKNLIIDAEALEKGDKTDEKWNTLQDAIKAAQKALSEATTADDITNGVSALKSAIKDFNKDTKGPEVDKVYYNDYDKTLEIAALGKTYDDEKDDFINNITSVKVNGEEYAHADYDAFDDDESKAATQYAFSYGAMKFGTGAFKDGDNTIVIAANGYDNKTIELTKSGDTYTFVSQYDGEKKADEGIQNPTEDGEYTVRFTTKTEGKDEESMIGRSFDSRAKLVRENGKMKITFLNTSLKSFLVDFSVDDNGVFNEATCKDWGEKNSSGEYDAQEFTMDIKDLTGSHKAAALVIAMGGQPSDIHNYDKYMKADLTFTSITKGWDGYQKEIDDSGKVTGSELTEKVLIDKGYDADGDGKISKEDVQAISGELDLSQCNLTDVSILKDLSDKVTKIDLSQNSIKELPAGLLDQATNLTYFYIENNFVSELPENFFKNNQKLNWISFSGNQIKELGDHQVSDLPNLTILDFSSNDIEKISANAFTGLTKLDDLGLASNLLTDLPDGLFKYMGNSLEYISLYSNGLTKLPKSLEDLSVLKTLSVFDNELKDISDFDFSKLAKAETITLHYNEITKLPKNAFAKNKSLNSLDLYDNQLTDFSTDNLPSGKVLQKLDLRLNNLKVIDPALRKAAQSYNKFTPQKSVVNLKVSANGNNGIKWAQDFGTLDLVLWLDETTSDRQVERTSVAEYKQMLKDNDWDGKKVTEILDDEGYDWDVVTELQKKNANGKFETVSSETISNKDEVTSGTFKAGEGTYRIVKTVYTLTSGSSSMYRTSVYSNEFTYKKGSSTTTVKVSTPTSVKAASAAYNKVKISWNKVSGVSGYEVYQYNAKTKKYTKVATVKGTSYTKSGLTTGTSYSYKVRAYKTVDKKNVYGSYSKAVSAKPSLSKVAGVKTVNVSGKAVKVTWKKVSGASGYKLYRSTKKNGSYKLVKTVKGYKTVKYTNKKLKKGKTYFYKVRAYKTVGKKKVYGSYSSYKSVKVRK